MRRSRRLRVVVMILATSFTPAVRGQAPSSAALPSARPTGAHEVAVDRPIMVPMRDGVRLAADIYRPRGVSGALPTILGHNYDETTWRVAKNSIYHADTHLSRLILPVVVVR